MSLIIANLYQAKTNLSKYVAQAIAGQDVVIAKAGKPLVRLTSYEPSRKARQPGKMKGKIAMSSDFTAESEEINNLFYGSSSK